MRLTHARAAHLHHQYRRDRLVDWIERLLMAIDQHAEAVGMFALVCVFWGLVLYTALAGLP